MSLLVWGSPLGVELAWETTSLIRVGVPVGEQGRPGQGATGYLQAGHAPSFVSKDVWKMFSIFGVISILAFY